MPQKLSIMDNICQRNTISINISNGSFPCDPEISNQEKNGKMVFKERSIASSWSWSWSPDLLHSSHSGPFLGLCRLFLQPKLCLYNPDKGLWPLSNAVLHLIPFSWIIISLYPARHIHQTTLLFSSITEIGRVARRSLVSLLREG